MQQDGQKIIQWASIDEGRSDRIDEWSIYNFVNISERIDEFLIMPIS